MVMLEASLTALRLSFKRLILTIYSYIFNVREYLNEIGIMRPNDTLEMFNLTETYYWRDIDRWVCRLSTRVLRVNYVHSHYMVPLINLKYLSL